MHVFLVFCINIMVEVSKVIVVFSKYCDIFCGLE